MQNKSNYLRFLPENEDYAEKQSQFKPNSNPIKANFGLISRVAKPKQTQFKSNLSEEHVLSSVEGSAKPDPIEVLWRIAHPVNFLIAHVLLNNYSDIKTTEDYKVKNEQRDKLMTYSTVGSQGNEFFKPIQKSKNQTTFVNSAPCITCLRSKLRNSL